MEKQPSISSFLIIKEAFKISTRNGKILLFITIIMLSYYTAMEFTHSIIFIPIANDLVSHATVLARSPLMDAHPFADEAFRKDLRSAVTYLFFYMCFMFLVLAFSVSATVHSSFEAHTNKVLGLKDVLLGIRRRWKRALKTTILIWIFSIVIKALFLLGFVLVLIMAEGHVLTALNWGMAIFGCFYAISLFSLFMVSLVVSVIEEGFSDLRAICEANEIRKGKKWQGFVLMAVMLFLNSVAFGFHDQVSFLLINFESRVSGADRNEKMAMDVAMGVPTNLVRCVLMLCVFVVFTVYYSECKKMKMEKETRDLYAPLDVDQV